MRFLLLFTILLSFQVSYSDDSVYVPVKSGAAGHKSAGAEAQYTEEDYRMMDQRHEGYTQRHVDKQCTNIDDKNKREDCQAALAGEEATVFGEGGDMVVGALSKAYTMIMGTMGGDFDRSGSRAEARMKADGATDEKASTGQDNCRFIPMGVEMVAAAKQALDGQKAEQAMNQSNNPQRDTLYNTADMHKSRRVTSYIQAAGWWTTAACYTALIAAGGGGKDPKIVIKTAGSVLLGTFHTAKAVKHNKYYKRVKGIADGMKGMGKCDPITDRICYCSQPETENDPKYCLPTIYARRAKENTYTTSCINKQGQNDDSCSCLMTDTCFDTSLNEMFGGAQGFSISPTTLRPIADISRGNIGRGNLERAGSGSNIIARNAIDRLKNELEPVELTPAQEKEAKAMSDLGVPYKIAAHLAKSPATKDSKANLARFRGGRGLRYNRPKIAGRSEDKTLRFSNAKNFGGKKKSSGDSNPYLNKFLKKKKGSGNESQKYLTFAQKAQLKAEIHQDNSRPIFEIISRRYQVSGRKHLEN